MKSTILFSGLLAASAALVWTSAEASARNLPEREVRFDGVDDLIHVPFAPSLDVKEAFTLELWLFANAVDAGGIAGMWGMGGLVDKFLVYLEQGEVVGRIARDGVPFHDTVHAPIPNGSWNHLALVFDGNLLSLYVNAVLVDQIAAVGGLGSFNIDFRMGIEDIFNAPPEYLDGKLEQVRLWKVSRSPDELSWSMRTKIAPDNEGLVASWNFDDADQTVADSSPFANHGTLGMDATPAADDPSQARSDAPIRFEDLGFALAGSQGDPRLQTRGTLIGGLPFELRIDRAQENSTAVLIAGLSRIDVPVLGGVFVPSPDIIVGLPTDATGVFQLATNWPAGIVPETSLFLQAWIKDSVAPFQFSATNAVRAETP